MSKTPKTRPGAERMDLTRKVMRGGKVETIEEDRRKQIRRRMTITAFVFSLLFAVVYSFSYAETSAVMNLFDSPMLNKLFFGPGTANIIDGGMIDQVLNILVRTLFFMAIFGVLPMATHLYARSRDVSNINPYQLMWGMAAFLAMFIAFIHALGWPLFAEVLENFSF